MTDIIRMKAVEPILYGVLKITWQDGFQAIVDLRPVMADGEVFEFLRQTPARFNDVKLEEYGHSIFWLDDDGDEVDFDCDSLRHRAIRQAEILRVAS
ncbi:MAG: DUF2442 domain-containing protein [Hyphomicrobiaceae bacterium]|nr:DUF2442 domain-containing protein [Hyphomicrobiaceae bacterium]